MTTHTHTDTDTDPIHKKPHSADYFGEYRDFWWNDDFLALMSRRLQLSSAQSVLDVGCGIGHWGQLLSPYLSASAQVTGVDREEEWVEKAAQRAAQRGLGERYRYQPGDALELPFEDAAFDLVTCQTVLIHLKDPRAGLREMLRVLKPGGTLLASEPNNFANRAVGSSLSEALSVDEIVARLRFGLILERGKQALGLGFNSVGDLIPGYLAELDVGNIQVYLSDKTSPYFAPYSSQEQKVNVQQIKDWAASGFAGFDRDEALRFYLAGGGSELEFRKCWEVSLRDDEAQLKAIENGTFHTAGGGMFYLISAQKPIIQ